MLWIPHIISVTCIFFYTFWIDLSPISLVVQWKINFLLYDIMHLLSCICRLVVIETETAPTHNSRYIIKFCVWCNVFFLWHFDFLMWVRSRFGGPTELAFTGLFRRRPLTYIDLTTENRLHNVLSWIISVAGCHWTHNKQLEIPQTLSALQIQNGRLDRLGPKRLVNAARMTPLQVWRQEVLFFFLLFVCDFEGELYESGLVSVSWYKQNGKWFEGFEGRWKCTAHLGTFGTWCWRRRITNSKGHLSKSDFIPTIVLLSCFIKAFTITLGPFQFIIIVV